RQSSRLPSHSSRLHGLPSSVQAVPLAFFASAGQSGPLPGHLSAMSHSPAAARQTTFEGWKSSAGQLLPTPSQVSTASQAPAAGRHTAPAFPAGCWQSSPLPSHSSRLHGLPSSVQAVPLAFFVSAGQAALDPVQNSAGSHSPAAARHKAVAGRKVSAGQGVLVPLQVSATSQSPADARHIAPALPAGCWQVTCVPSQVSVVQGLPSSVQSVPLAFFASAGQLGPFPGQLSATSHSPAAARHTTLADWKPSAGQLLPTPSQVSATSQVPAEARQTVLAGLLASAGHAVLAPVHVSATSHAPAAARHTAPALPAGCWQVACVPSQVSVVQGLLSSVQAVPLAFFASAGQLGPLPGQLSATSQSPAAARHTVLAGRKASAGHAPFAPLHVSATSQVPAEARQTVPADFNLQFALQQELAEPFAAPSSHSSPEEF